MPSPWPRLSASADYLTRQIGLPSDYLRSTANPKKPSIPAGLRASDYLDYFPANLSALVEGDWDV